MEENKMRPSRPKLIFLFLSICLILPVEFVWSGPNSGADIIFWARSVVNYPRLDGQPPNKSDNYGIVFDYSNWVRVNDKVTFDCTGIVCWAAGLRRHYFLSNYTIQPLLNSGSWFALQKGNIVASSAHMMIFDYWKDGKDGSQDTDVAILIHASASANKVIEDEISRGWLQNNSFAPYSFKSDSTNPSVSVSGIVNNGLYNTSRTVFFSVSDNVAGSDFYAYGEYPPNGGTKFARNTNQTFSNDGNYTVRFYASDWALNITDFNNAFTIDKTAPATFVLTSPADNVWTNTNMPNFSWSASSDAGSGLAKYQLYINGALNRDNIPPSATTATPVSALANGSHSWYVRAVDNAGNIRDSSSVRIVKIDTAPPTISNRHPVSFFYTNNPRPTISANYSDVESGINTASVALKVNGYAVPASVGPNSVSYTPTSDLSERHHYIQLAVNDNIGNAVESSWDFYTDFTAPLGEISLNDTNSRYPEALSDGILSIYTWAKFNLHFMLNGTTTSSNMQYEYKYRFNYATLNLFAGMSWAY